MAEANKPKPPLHLEGVNDVSATWADVFLVAADPEAGVTNIYFFAKHLSIPGGTAEGTLEIPSGDKAKCVAHIILSQKGGRALLDGLKKNQEFTRQLSQQKEKQK